MRIKVIILILLFGFNLSAQEKQKEIIKPTVKLRGRIVYDFEFLSAGNEYNLSGNEFRRAWLGAFGNITKDISYVADFALESGEVNFRSLYIKFNLPKDVGTLKVGNFIEPTNLENMISGRYHTFMERAMMTFSQPFLFNTGFMYENYNLFGSKVGLQLSYTFNGDRQDSFRDKSLKGGANFVARVSGAVINNTEKKQLLHLGVNYEHRDNDSDDYSYSFRTENHMGEKIKVEADGSFKNTNDIGFELATTFGALSLQAEYETSSIVTDIDSYTAHGYYGYASYFITGENRPYKNGRFGRLKPKKDLYTKGGLGAIELAARYSAFDLSNYPGVTDNNKIVNFTAAVNWYLHSNFRIMYNYTNANFNDLQVYGTENLTGHLIRFQLYF